MPINRNQKGDIVSANQSPGMGWYSASPAFKDESLADYYNRTAVSRQQSQSMALFNLYQKMAEESKQANIKREKEIRKLYANMLNSLTGSNNSLRASGLADIETESARLVGSETQQMISSGLYGTTTAGAIPRNVATGFTQPSRLKLEDLISSRKRELQLGLAGFVERIENPYPDYNSLMQAMIASRQ